MHPKKPFSNTDNFSLETPEQEARRLSGLSSEESSAVVDGAPSEVLEESGVALDERYRIPTPGSDRAQGDFEREPGTPRSPWNSNEMSDLVAGLSSDEKIISSIADYRKAKAKLAEIKATREYQKVKEEDRWKYGMVKGFNNKAIDMAGVAFRESQSALANMHARLKELLLTEGVAINGVFDRELATEEFLVKSLNITD